MRTVITYKLNGTTYTRTFGTRVSYGTVEQYLIMEKHIGRSQIESIDLRIKNLLR